MLHQYKFLLTVPQNILVVFYFTSTTVLGPIAAIYQTQACAVTLDPAPVLYLGKLPVDAAIHALIFRQVNRILYLKTYFFIINCIRNTLNFWCRLIMVYLLLFALKSYCQLLYFLFRSCSFLFTLIRWLKLIILNWYF